MTDFIYGKIVDGQFTYATPDELAEGCCQLYDFDLASRYNTNPQQVVVQNNELVDITLTPEYKDKIANEQAEILKLDLQRRIDDLDKKRIRAVCEMEIKDQESGETWLEFYNEQIKTIRAALIGI